LKPIRRRLGAATTGAVLVGGSILAVVASAAAPTVASAAANTTFNDNGCTTAAAANSVSTIPIGLSSDQTDAGLANSVDPLTGLTIPGGVMVSAGSTYAAAASVVVGGSASLTGVTAQGFVSAAFLQAGVGLGFINVGDTVNGTISATINAANATFDTTQPAGVTYISPTQVSVSGAGGGLVVGTGSTVTAPLDVTVSVPNISYTATSTPNVTAYFYQDDTPALPTTPAGDPSTMPGNGNGSATHTTAILAAIIPHLPTISIGCLPGDGTNPSSTTFTQTVDGSQYLFAAAQVLPAQPPTLVPQTLASVNKGGSGIIHTLNGATDNVPIDPSSVTVVTPPAHGNTSVNPVNGDITYTNDGTGAGGGDSFTVTASSSGGTSSPPTLETITTILNHPQQCDVTSQPSCTLAQIVEVP